MSEFVRTSQVGHAYRIELNRPDRGNLVTTEMVFALMDAARAGGFRRQRHCGSLVLPLTELTQT